MPFAIKTVGGPYDGETRMVETLDELRSFGLDWPMPDVLPVPADVGNGRYVRINMSELPIEAANNPHVALGAEYEWEELGG